MTIENARQLFNLQQRNRNLVTELQQKLEEQEKTLKLFKKYVPEQVVNRTLMQTGQSIFEGESRDSSSSFLRYQGIYTLK